MLRRNIPRLLRFAEAINGTDMTTTTYIDPTIVDLAEFINTTNRDGARRACISIEAHRLVLGHTPTAHASSHTLVTLPKSAPLSVYTLERALADAGIDSRWFAHGHWTTA